MFYKKAVQGKSAISRLYLCAMKLNKNLFVLIIAVCLCVMSCTSIDIYEKSVAIPGHAWQNSFRPTFEFTIKDTTVLYQPYLVLRHNEKYSYSNIYINLYIKAPGEDSTKKIQKDLSLATNENWKTNTAMDDIYEHRVRITPRDGVALRKGEYEFTIGHIMREDPLMHIMNIGLRVEKKTVAPQPQQ